MGKTIYRPVSFSRRRILPLKRRWSRQKQFNQKGIRINPSFIRGNIHTIFDGFFDSKPSASLWIRRAKNHLLGLDSSLGSIPTTLIDRFMYHIRNRYSTCGSSVQQYMIMQPVINFLRLEQEIS